MYINSDEVTFTGRSGALITIARNSANDYEAWIRDDETRTETDGFSVRGSLLDVIRDLIDEF